jgi:hypothetical protein
LLNSYIGFAKRLFVLCLVGCGQVVKLEMPQPGSKPSDPNVSGSYVCIPSDKWSLDCKSGVAYSASDRQSAPRSPRPVSSTAGTGGSGS